MLPQFVESVWNLLMSLDNSPKYDVLVGHAVQIMSSVAKRHIHLLSNEQIIQNICEKIIIPNMSLRGKQSSKMSLFLYDAAQRPTWSSLKTIRPNM